MPILFSESHYVSPGLTFEEFGDDLGICERSFYNLVNAGYFLSCRMGARIVMVKTNFSIENGWEIQEGYRDFKEHWLENCHILLGEKCTLKKIANALNISYGLLYTLVTENRRIITVQWKGNKMYIDPKEIVKVMKDLDE